MTTPSSLQLLGALDERRETMLTPDALGFLCELHGRFEPARRELLAARARRQAAYDAGERPDVVVSERQLLDLTVPGGEITEAGVRVGALADEVVSALGPRAGGRFEQARALFEQIALAAQPVDFLTEPGYPLLLGA